MTSGIVITGAYGDMGKTCNALDLRAALRKYLGLRIVVEINSGPRLSISLDPTDSRIAERGVLI
jgi:hypothetical protein